MAVAIVAAILVRSIMSDLKPVEEALALGSEQMCWDAIDGVKQISVRPGNRRYTDGNVLVIYREECAFIAKATVSSVRYCTLGKLTDEELQADGYITHNELLDDLNERFYKGSLSLESDMTVLRWRDIKGPVVDDRRAKRAVRASN